MDDIGLGRDSDLLFFSFVDLQSWSRILKYYLLIYLFIRPCFEVKCGSACSQIQGGGTKM